MSVAFPGVFPGGLTTGYLNAGAVQKQRTSLAFPGVFPAALTTGYLNTGAVQMAIVAPSTPSTQRMQCLGLKLGLGLSRRFAA